MLPIILAIPPGAERDLVEEIYLKYEKIMLNEAKRHLTKKDDVEDAIQTSIMNVIKNVTSFIDKSEKEIVSQIVIYTRNAAKNIAKKNNRYDNEKSKTTYDDDDDTEPDIKDDDADIELIVLSNETAEIINQAINLLPETQGDVIRLKYFHNHTNAKIAEIIRITPNAVSARLYKAKQNIIKLGGEQLYERYKN